MHLLIDRSSSYFFLSVDIGNPFLICCCYWFYQSHDAGYVIMPGYDGRADSSTDDIDEDYHDSPRGSLPPPCTFVFENDGVIINGRSNLQRQPRSKKVCIQPFNDYFQGKVVDETALYDATINVARRRVSRRKFWFVIAIQILFFSVGNFVRFGSDEGLRIPERIFSYRRIRPG